MTLFHKLSNVLPIHFLDTQYRMHPLINAFPSNNFYNGKLMNGINESERSFSLFKFPKDDFPICFIDLSDDYEYHVGTSICNNKQAEIVILVINKLLSNGVQPFDIVILTPYSAQLGLIKSLLNNNHVEVSSIDAFQGREKDIVIFCTVRANDCNSLGFISDTNRMNVLLTRARRGIIGIGHSKTMKLSTFWNKWLQEIPFLDIKELITDKEKRIKFNVRQKSW